jgi:RNA polymerase sigma-70 factor (ECF subfamily)
MLQECWLRIHRSRHTYRPGAPVLPWLFAIARYTRIDAYRRRRQIDANELAVEDVTASGPGEPALADRVDLDLWRLVGQLPPSQQEVVQMLKVSGLSLEEVARATGSSVGSVKQKAHRAYQKLRELLNIDREARKNG